MVEYRMHRVSWLSSTEGKAHVDFEHSREDVTALSIAFSFQVVGREAPVSGSTRGLRGYHWRWGGK